jgi:large subunit ribosomal protein L13
MKTFLIKAKLIERKWHLVDVEGDSLGRVATKVALLLAGKCKTQFSPHQDLGDFVVVVNANKIKVTGKKFKDKMYYHYSGYPGGIKGVSFEEKFKKNPKWLIWHAVRNMLPSNRLRTPRLKRLKIYLDEKHPHQAQLAQIKVE